MSLYAAQVLAQEDGLPGMELLEFLVEWETADGQWIDPVELDEPATAPQEKTDVERPHD
ncbi:MAG: hypothetical protein R3308_08090 [Thiohalobacterales bacterium]|nr:hypothetical protein [Thiohalobacterales bacterium]